MNRIFKYPSLNLYFCERGRKNKTYPEGHFVGMWMGIGIAIFTGIGVPLSFALENPGLIGIGPALGVAFGLALGQSIEDKYRKEGKIRPLTKDEKHKKEMLVTAGIAVCMIGLALFLILLFL
ncbi:MAG: hypothetical protein PHD13_05710 [Methanocellales archaeon]|nr:hypothetical protein [Methanocellales archaeon]MDD3291948.1 hypothetical protein [Methanocellales archaeon]MDD5235651.1 hypothetical protein [Methanocellales archaeon]MDD5485498.1 hypothetical protein [Methanocellales archaeon]